MVAMFFKNVSGTDRLKLVFALPAAIVTHAYSLLGVAVMLYTFSANLLVPLVYFGIMDNLKIHHKNSVYILRRDNFHAFIGMAESASVSEKTIQNQKRRRTKITERDGSANRQILFLNSSTTSVRAG